MNRYESRFSDGFTSAQRRFTTYNTWSWCSNSINVLAGGEHASASRMFYSQRQAQPGVRHCPSRRWERMAGSHPGFHQSLALGPVGGTVPTDPYEAPLVYPVQAFVPGRPLLKFGPESPQVPANDESVWVTTPASFGGRTPTLCALA